MERVALEDQVGSRVHLDAAVPVGERIAAVVVDVVADDPVGRVRAGRGGRPAAAARSRREANRRAAEADPTLALASFNMGIGHLHLGEPERAVECLGRAIEIEPASGAAYFHLAIALHALRRTDEARLCAAYAAELGYRAPPASADALRHAEAGAGASTAGQWEGSPSSNAEGDRHVGTAQGR